MRTKGKSDRGVERERVDRGDSLQPVSMEQGGENLVQRPDDAFIRD